MESSYDEHSTFKKLVETESDFLDIINYCVKIGVVTKQMLEEIMLGADLYVRKHILLHALENSTECLHHINYLLIKKRHNENIKIFIEKLSELNADISRYENNRKEEITTIVNRIDNLAETMSHLTVNN